MKTAGDRLAEGRRAVHDAGLDPTTRSDLVTDYAAARNRDEWGQAIYAIEVAANPTYHDGTPRAAWSQMTEDARESWRQAPRAIDAAGQVVYFE